MHVCVSTLCLSPYFDLLAFVVVIALTLLLCKGIRESTVINNIITALNLSVIGILLPSSFDSAPVAISLVKLTVSMQNVFF